MRGKAVLVALSFALSLAFAPEQKCCKSAAAPAPDPGDAHASSPVTLPASFVNGHDGSDHSSGFAPAPPTGCTEIDVGVSLPGGCAIITVDAGQNLQTALNTAAGRTGSTSDIIRIEAFGVSGAIFEDGDDTGYQMPLKAGTGWVHVITSGTMPAAGNRVNPILGGTPGEPNALPIGVTGNVALGEFAVIRGTGTTPHFALDAQQDHDADIGTFNWNWIGIHFSADTFSSAFVRTYDDGETDLPLTHHIVFDRVYVSGKPDDGGDDDGANVCMVIAGRRGNGDSHHAVINSYIADCFVTNAESKGILFSSVTVAAVVNSYVEASGISVYVDMGDAAYNPSDVEVVGNFFSKPIAWNIDAAFVTNKNCFEVKSGVRVLYHGNMCQNVWVEAQETAINIKIGDELAEKFTEDITIRYSVIRDSANAVKMCMGGCNGPGQTGNSFALYNNLFININGADFGGDDEGHGMAFFQIITGNGPYIISHNTSINTGPCVGLTQTVGVGGPYDGGVFDDNICAAPVTFLRFTEAEAGTIWAGGYTYARNVIVDSSCASYPAGVGNQCPANYTAVGFEDFNGGEVGGDFRLAASSTYKGDGQDTYNVGTTDPGANIPDVLAATACAITGQCAP